MGMTMMTMGDGCMMGRWSGWYDDGCVCDGAYDDRFDDGDAVR